MAHYSAPHIDRSRKYMRRLPLLLLLETCSLPACADLPMSVEDVITAKGKFRSELSIVYANSERQSVSLGDAILIQTGPASFLTLPTGIGDSYVNSDTVVSTLGARYGFSSDSEAYLRVSTSHSQQRHQDVNGITESNVTSGVADAWLGITHQFKPDSASPAMLGFIELALEEKHRYSFARFQSVMLGLSAYVIFDPVVLSATVAARVGESRMDGTFPFSPGNFYLFNPLVTFAVNDRVTLTGGMQWTWKQSDLLNHVPIGIDRSSTDLVTGFGVVMSDASTFNTSFKINASGRAGSELRLTWLHTL